LLEKLDHVDVLAGKAIEVYPDKNEILLFVDGKKIIYHFNDLVLAIGGRSYDRQDYDYQLLDSLKVRYLPYQSMLCPVKTVEKIPAYLNKNRLRGTLSLYSGDKKLYEEEVYPLLSKGLSVAVYTQLTDVEGELNGLFTYDRKMEKVDFKFMAAINERLKFE
jgi:hypothetical protein